MKILLHGYCGETEEREVPAKKTFDYLGYTWAIHRPVDLSGDVKKNNWKVSEFSTGFSAGNKLYKTMKEAENEAKKIIDNHSDVLDRAVSNARERHGIINKEIVYV